MNPDLHDTAATRLRGDGQRYTANRRAIVDVLDRATAPMTIAEIVAARRGLAVSSVYRNLAILERADVVHRVVTSDEFARYELAEDLSEHHHHLICSACGFVEDFTATSSLERAAARALEKVAAEAGFTFQSHRLDVIGLCRSCA